MAEFPLDTMLAKMIINPEIFGVNPLHTFCFTIASCPKKSAHWATCDSALSFILKVL